MHISVDRSANIETHTYINVMYIPLKLTLMSFMPKVSRAFL